MTQNQARTASERPALSTAPSLAVCIVNYQGELHLPWTLESVTRSVRPDELIVVDNASADRSLEIVDRRCPSARVLRLTRNRGPAAARNAALATVRADRVLFLDNDVILDPGTLEELNGALDADAGAAIAMPRVVHADDPETIQYDGADAHWLGLMTLRNAGRSVRRAGLDVSEIGSLVTACFLLDRRRLPADVSFDETFFFTYEDHDFGLGIRARGGRIVSVPRAVCLHRDGTPGLSWRPDANYPRRRIYGLVRNRWLVVLKTYRARTLAVLAPGLLAYEVLQIAGLAWRGWLGEWRRAAVWIFRNRSRVLAARRAVQRNRRVPSDRRLLVGGPVPLTAGFCRGRFERAVKRAIDAFASGYWNVARRAL